MTNCAQVPSASSPSEHLPSGDAPLLPNEDSAVASDLTTVLPQREHQKDFGYEPLPTPTSIRLIKLHPPQSNTDGPIRCSMETVALENAPAFTTLSYTWGNPFQKDPQPFPEERDLDHEYRPDAKHTIIVNGRPVLVQRNLYEALCQFQKIQAGEDLEVSSYVTTNPLDEIDLDSKYGRWNKSLLVKLAERGDSDSVRYLLSHGADIHSQDNFGETALHYAAENGHLETVKELVAAGANLTIKDTKERTALDCAYQRERRKFKETREYLRGCLEGCRDTSEPVSGHSEPIEQVPPYLETHFNPVKEDQPLEPLIEQVSRHMWIDALCINQEDILERNSQVAIMNQIYATSKSTVVWLGVEDQYSKALCESIGWMVRVNRRFYGPDRLYDRLRVSELLVVFQHLLARDRRQLQPKYRKTEERLRSILALLRRAWFSRVWVIQELARAQEAVMLCGSKVIQWDHIAEMAKMKLPPFSDFIGFSSMTRVFGGDESDMTLNWTTLGALGDIRARTEQYSIEEKRAENALEYAAALNDRPLGDTFSLPNLLNLSWKFHSTDPRDKIIALLNLATEDDSLPAIVPDYTKTTEELYIAAAAHLMTGSGSDQVLDISTGRSSYLEPLQGFSFVQPIGKDPSLLLPSWVPDFSGPLKAPTIYRKDFKAALDIRGGFSFPGDGMCLQSVHLDRVKNVEEDVNDDNHAASKDKIKTYNPASWLDITLSLGPSYITGGSSVEALWRTLAVDVMGKEVDTYKKQTGSFNEMLKRCAAEDDSSSQRIPDLLQQLEPYDDLHVLPRVSELDKARDKEPEDYRLLDEVNHPVATKIKAWTMPFRLTMGRRLFRTVNGYLGLGPLGMVPGDEVHLFAGGRMAYVLRKEKGSYRFVGEAYVHGVMYGEAAQRRKDDFTAILLH